MAGGVALLDFNLDGHLDVYFTGGSDPDRLYQNMGDGSFMDVSHPLGITALDHNQTMGVVSGDLNADGYPDLVVTTATGDHVHLLLNEEGQRFRDVSLGAGLHHAAWSSSASLADIDRDGDLDIYVGNYLTYSQEPFDQNIVSPEADFLYRNNGNGTFELLPSPLGDGDKGCTLATLFADYDQDGWQDLFVLMDFGDFYGTNQLLRGGPGPWESVGQGKGMRAAMNAMGIAGGDLNEDGLTDYFVTNIGSNHLYLGNEKGPYTEIASQVELADGTGMSWGTAMQDFDNDGHLDVYVSKGYINSIPFAQFNRLYLGNGPELTFEDLSLDMFVRDMDNKARGVAWGDLNNDGRLDLVVSGIRTNREHTARSLIYMNQEHTGNWLRLHPTTDGSNSVTAGLSVTLYAGGRQMERTLYTGDSYLSSSESVLHFGLGEVQSIDSIIVHWPDGTTRQEHLAQVNQDYTISPVRPARVRTFADVEICPDERVPPPMHVPGLQGAQDTIVYYRRKERSVSVCSVPKPPSESLRIHPSPATDYLRVQPPGGFDGLLTVRLMSVHGQPVLTREYEYLPGSTLTVTDLGDLPRGIYFLHLHSAAGETARAIVLH